MWFRRSWVRPPLFTLHNERGCAYFDTASCLCLYPELHRLRIEYFGKIHKNRSLENIQTSTIKKEGLRRKNLITAQPLSYFVLICIKNYQLSSLLVVFKKNITQICIFGNESLFHYPHLYHSRKAAAMPLHSIWLPGVNAVAYQNYKIPPLDVIGFKILRISSK